MLTICCDQRTLRITPQVCVFRFDFHFDRCEGTVDDVLSKMKFCGDAWMALCAEPLFSLSSSGKYTLKSCPADFESNFGQARGDPQLIRQLGNAVGLVAPVNAADTEIADGHAVENDSNEGSISGVLQSLADSVTQTNTLLKAAHEEQAEERKERAEERKERAEERKGQIARDAAQDAERAEERKERVEDRKDRAKERKAYTELMLNMVRTFAASRQPAEAPAAPADPAPLDATYISMHVAALMIHIRLNPTTPFTLQLTPRVPSDQVPALHAALNAAFASTYPTATRHVCCDHTWTAFSPTPASAAGAIPNLHFAAGVIFSADTEAQYTVSSPITKALRDLTTGDYVYVDPRITVVPDGITPITLCVIQGVFPPRRNDEGHAYGFFRVRDVAGAFPHFDLPSTKSRRETYFSFTPDSFMAYERHIKGSLPSYARKARNPTRSRRSGGAAFVPVGGEAGAATAVERRTRTNRKRAAPGREQAAPVVPVVAPAPIESAGPPTQAERARPAGPAGLVGTAATPKSAGTCFAEEHAQQPFGTVEPAATAVDVEVVAKAAVFAVVEAAIADFTGLPPKTAVLTSEATRPLPPAAANAAAEGAFRQGGVFRADVFDKPPFSRHAMDQTFGPGGSLAGSQLDHAFVQHTHSSSLFKRHAKKK